MLFLFVVLVCIVAPLIFAGTRFRMESPSELLLRFKMLRLILKKQSSRPQMPPPSEIFRQHVLDPIPKSVTNVKADQPREIGGFMYTLRFDINRADIDMLIDSGPMERVWNVRYGDRRLDWGWDQAGPGGRSMYGHSMIVYGRREPGWFRPELWDNPEAFASREEASGRTITRVLLYDEREGEAYFIISSFK